MPLETAYRVDAETKRFFDDNGFVKLPAVLDPDTINEYEPEITSKVIALNTQHLPLAERDTYGKAFLQVMNLWQQSDKARELVFSRRLADRDGAVGFRGWKPPFPPRTRHADQRRIRT